MGPGFESQRDHKKATPKELLFLCPMDSNRSVGMGSILEGSGLVFGDRGTEPLPAGSQKKATPKELLFLYLVIRPMSIFKALGLSVFCNLIYFFYSIKRIHLSGIEIFI